MSKGAAAPIRIDEEWVDDAACAVSDLPAYVWDEEVDGETDLQRLVRWQIARHVCHRLCPVVADCYEHAVRTRSRRLAPGVRGGHPFT